jgi:TPR repeat protein
LIDVGCVFSRPLNHKEAACWTRKAADRGNVDAQYNLAIHYENGLGLVQDKKEAVRWFRKAADERHASAHSSIGVMYLNGKGVTQDHKEAFS